MDTVGILIYNYVEKSFENIKTVNMHKNQNGMPLIEFDKINKEQ